MLKTLSIKNYALIADIEIGFDAGLSIITGETGAGKSILLGALGTILGDRADTTMIRAGATKAAIEGVFEISKCKSLIHLLKEEELYQDDNQLFLRREIYDNGRTRAFINDTPVQLSIVKSVGDLLVDLHGQHEHQSLLNPKHHLSFIDEIGGFENELDYISTAFKHLKSLQRQVQELESKQAELKEKRDSYQFQLDEISKVNPLPDEEEALLEEEKVVRNGEKLFKITQNINQILYESENSVFDRLNFVHNKLEELGAIDKFFLNLKPENESARTIIDEIAKACQTYGAKIEFNPERLDTIQDRLAELSGLKKKYNRTIPELIEYKEQIFNNLSEFESFDEQGFEIQNQIGKARELLGKLCIELSSKRKAVAFKLENEIPQMLEYLGIPHSRFNVCITYQDDPDGEIRYNGENYQASANGMDVAEFRISTNAGGDVRPLVKVASGGEISRIMLALKSILAQKGQIPVLVFDEIDNGVSGRIARTVGKKLNDLANYHQVICITHLPQIASLGQNHYLVEKMEQAGNTETKIKKLSNEERTLAVAQLLAGESISEAHLRSAKELLDESVAENE